MIKIFYRISNARDRHFFTDPEINGMWHGAVISAHIAAYHRGLIGEFLEDTGIPFFVDPMTANLARNIDIIKKERNIKKSYEKLINEYGDIKRIILEENRSLDISDFEDDMFCERFVEHVLNFQSNLIESEKQSTLDEILELAEIKKEKRIVKPLFLIPPYFYSEEYGDDWYNISKKLAKIALKFKGEYKIYPVICISKEMLLDYHILERIVSDYRLFPGILLWINNFNEHDCEQEYLEGYIHLIKLFKKENIEVISLYGGFFSLMLNKIGLDGICSGICYGESRNIDQRPTTGGGASKYYLPQLHIKISGPIASQLVKMYSILECKCKICERIKKEKRDYSNVIANDINEQKKHYISRRWDEYREISNKSKYELSKILEDDFNLLKSLEGIEDLIGNNLNYLNIWRIIIEVI